MRATLNYTNRRDLHKQHINLERIRDGKKTGIRFGIKYIDEHAENDNFDKNDKVILFAQDKLCVETIHIGTVNDLIIASQYKIYDVQDKTILHSSDLVIDVHIVSPDGKIKSRTDKIFLGEKNKPGAGTDIPFEIQTKDIGKKVYEIGDNNDNLICYVSSEIPDLKANILNENSLEHALLKPQILKDAFVYALIIHPESTGENEDHWKESLLQHIEEDELPEEDAEIIKLIDKSIEHLTIKWKLQDKIKNKYEEETKND